MAVQIHGKEYFTVAERIGKFREDFPAWTIETQIVSIDEKTVVVQARILNEEGRLISSGIAEEHRASSSINKTSALENCETSAVGRALAFFGLAGTEIASADEVANAIRQQNGSRKSQDNSGRVKEWIEQWTTEANKIADDGHREKLLKGIAAAAEHQDRNLAARIEKEIQEAIALPTY